MFWFNGFFCDIRSEENLTAVAFHGTADCGLLTVVISRPKPKDRRCFRWRGFWFVFGGWTGCSVELHPDCCVHLCGTRLWCSWCVTCCANTCLTFLCKTFCKIFGVETAFFGEFSELQRGGWSSCFVERELRKSCNRLIYKRKRQSF